MASVGSIRRNPSKHLLLVTGIPGYPPPPCSLASNIPP
jgi:hypothetical protein